jgi:hypothetical protein
MNAILCWLGIHNWRHAVIPARSNHFGEVMADLRTCQHCGKTEIHEL